MRPRAYGGGDGSPPPPSMSVKHRCLPCLQALAAFAAGTATSHSQTLEVSQAYLPRFQDMAFPDVSPMKGGISYHMGLEAIYDSNFFLEESDAQDELIFQATPIISYGSDPEGGALCSIQLEYAPVFKAYWENSDLNDVNHNFGGVFKYTGGRLAVTAYFRYHQLSGSDRLAEGYVEGSILNYGIVGSYQVAPRTTVDVTLGAASSDYDTGQQGADTYSMSVGANWLYSERLSVGPLFRYSRTEADSTGSRDSYALLVQARYLFEERTRISASLGVEKFSDSDSDTDDSQVGITGDLTASYAITERLGWSGTIRYATIPSPSTDDYFVQDLTIATELTRQLKYGSVGLGIAWSNSMYDAVDDLAADHEDDMYTSVTLSYSRDIFSERGTIDTSVSYAFNDGDREYSRWLVSLGVNFRF